jgi:hypothetical protein
MERRGGDWFWPHPALTTELRGRRDCGIGSNVSCVTLGSYTIVVQGQWNLAHWIVIRI